MALTDATLRGIKPPPAKSKTYADGRGLSIEVFATGGMVWRYRYTFDGKAEKLTLGKYPDLTLKAARLARDDAAHKVAEGINPVQEKREHRGKGPAMTVQRFAEVFIKDQVSKARKNPEPEIARWRNDILPYIGSLKLEELTHSVLHEVIWRKKDEGFDQAAKLLLGSLNRFCDYAISCGHLPHNPVSAIKPKHVATSRSRERTLTEQELGTFLNAVDGAAIHRSLKCALWLLTLTLVRKGELRRALWKDVHLQQAEWHIPAENSKTELVAALLEALEEATAFCAGHGVDFVKMEALPAGGLERLEAVENAIEALIAPEKLRRDFFGHEKLVGTLYRAVKPDRAALEFVERVAGILALATAVRTRLRPDPPDITEVMGQITGLLDLSIAGLTIRDAGPPAIDLSKINFEALAERFKTSKHKNTEIEALKAAIRARLDRLVRLNRTRTDFAEKFEELIESYNAGSRNIEQLFEELLRLSNSLDEEQERHVRENLAEEELVIFDILTRPAPELSAKERDDVKKVARKLLTRLKELLVLNWRQKSAARSMLRLAIEDTLDAGLPTAYARELYKQKCSAVFEHVYESYPERNAGIYAESA